MFLCKVSVPVGNTDHTSLVVGVTTLVTCGATIYIVIALFRWVILLSSYLSDGRIFAGKSPHQSKTNRDQNQRQSAKVIKYL